MAFTSQKYGTYGSKPWEFWVKSMGVTLRLRRTKDNGLRTTNNSRALAGSRLTAQDSFVCEALVVCKT